MKLQCSAAFVIDIKEWRWVGWSNESPCDPWWLVSAVYLIQFPFIFCKYPYDLSAQKCSDHCPCLWHRQYLIYSCFSPKKKFLAGNNILWTGLRRIKWGYPSSLAMVERHGNLDRHLTLNGQYVFHSPNIHCRAYITAYCKHTKAQPAGTLSTCFHLRGRAAQFNTHTVSNIEIRKHSWDYFLVSGWLLPGKTCQNLTCMKSLHLWMQKTSNSFECSSLTSVVVRGGRRDVPQRGHA